MPLLFPPDTNYHYSNIGYKTAAAIAEKGRSRLAGRPLPPHHHRPLTLTSAGYDPGAAIAGPDALGYVVEVDGRARQNAGAGEGALAASGGIVVNAHDEARFLVNLVQGRIVSQPYLGQIETPTRNSYGLGTDLSTICGLSVFTHVFCAA